MLEAVKVAVPENFTLVSSAYEHPSLLFCGDHILESAEGVQQEHPLAWSLTFCITIQSLVEKLKYNFCVFYLDDGIVGSSSNDILYDLYYTAC